VAELVILLVSAQAVSMSEEGEEREEVTVVEKSRDGRSYFQSFLKIQTELEEDQKKITDAILQNSGEEVAAIVTTCQTKARDRLGYEYFTQLDQHWNIISRAGLVEATIDLTPPPDPPRESEPEEKSFTQVYKNPTELDLSPRPRLKARTKARGRERPRPSPEDHERFVQAHQNNESQLKQLSEGSFSSLHCPLTLVSLGHTPRHDPPPPPDEIRWDSQLFPPPRVPKPHLQTFYDHHNSNVLAFQALLDDSITANSSRIGVLDSLTYRQFLDTDLFLHSATSFSDEIESCFLELLLTCRQMYIEDSLHEPLNQTQVVPFERRLFVVPEYEDTSVKEHSVDLFSRVNQWTLTDSSWNPIPTALNSQRFALGSLIRSKADGVLTKVDALVSALLSPTERWNKFHFLSTDSCRVQIDTVKGQAKLECRRWGKYHKEKVLLLPRQLRHATATGEASQLHLMFHRVDSQPLDNKVRADFLTVVTPSSE
jgi:hypothetical protein